MIGFVLAVMLTGCAAGHEPRQETDVRTFGQRQLEQLLDDRPDMKGILPPGHPVLQWVEKGFNGDRFGQRVYWIADSPRGGSVSEFWSPDAGNPPFIRLSAGTELTPVDRWAALVFEMHNLEGGHERFVDLTDRAAKGLLGGEQYAKDCVEVEFDALKETAAFLRANPLPESAHGRDTLYKQHLQDPGTFEKYWKEGHVKNERAGNYEHYLNHYQRVLAPAAAEYKAGDASNEPADR